MKGAWVEVLRFVFKKISFGGVKHKVDIASKVTGYFHTKHGMHHDTVRGAGNFGGSYMASEAFQIFKYISLTESPLTKTKYLRDQKNNIVNC